MVFMLPAPPKTADVVPGLTDNAARLKPPTGGPSQTILRPGDRYYAKVSIPALKWDCDTARAWLSALLRHKAEGGPLRMPWPTVKPSTLPAAAAIDGAGQGGVLLAIKGLAAGQTIPAVTPFSFIVGGRSYLHFVSATAVADGAGKVIASIAPRVRVSPGDGLALHFPDPVIEGELELGAFEWSLQYLRFVGFAFTITEIE